MQMKHFQVITGLVFVLCVTAAQAGPITGFADGKPWSVRTSDGMSMKMTFNPDGTGSMSVGPMKRKIKWKATDEGMCLIGVPGGERCLSLTKTEKGFMGKNKDGKSLTLSR
jgi:hypothetical protein